MSTSLRNGDRPGVAGWLWVATCSNAISDRRSGVSSETVDAVAERLIHHRPLVAGHGAAPLSSCADGRSQPG